MHNHGISPIANSIGFNVALVRFAVDAHNLRLVSGRKPANVGYLATLAVHH